MTQPRRHGPCCEERRARSGWPSARPCSAAIAHRRAIRPSGTASGVSMRGAANRPPHARARRRPRPTARRGRGRRTPAGRCERVGSGPRDGATRAPSPRDRGSIPRSPGGARDPSGHEGRQGRPAARTPTARGSTQRRSAASSPRGRRAVGRRGRLPRARPGQNIQDRVSTGAAQASPHVHVYDVHRGRSEDRGGGRAGAKDAEIAGEPVRREQGGRRGAVTGPEPAHTQHLDLFGIPCEDDLLRKPGGDGRGPAAPRSLLRRVVVALGERAQTQQVLVGTQRRDDLRLRNGRIRVGPGPDHPHIQRRRQPSDRGDHQFSWRRQPERAGDCPLPARCRPAAARAPARSRQPASRRRRSSRRARPQCRVAGPGRRGADRGTGGPSRGCPRATGVRRVQEGSVRTARS